VLNQVVFQIEKSRWRDTLAGCTVVIHELLDGRLAIRYGPHVVGYYNAAGQPLAGNGRAKKAPPQTATEPPKLWK
jgi:hypothetical protein